MSMYSLRSLKWWIVLLVWSFAVLWFSYAQTVVSTCDDWVAMNNDLEGDYVLSNDIDCVYTGNNVMIWTNFPTFQWSLDGNGHTVSYYISGTEENMWLFRVLQWATIQNLGLSGTVTSTNGQIGWLVGYIQNESTIENIFGTVDVSWEDYVWWVAGTTAANNQSFSWINLQGTVVGGWLGSHSSVWWILGESSYIISIDSSSFSGSISADGDYVWWLAWSLFTGYIDNSNFVWSIQGIEQIGGIAGIMYRWSITQSSADVTIDGFNTVWWLVGNTLWVSIRDSHAIVDLSISDLSYGFLWWLVGSLDGSILRSYAIGTLSWTISVWWLVGWAGNSTISQSYADVNIWWDDELWWLVGYMQDAEIYDSYALWDIYPNSDGSAAGWAIGILNGWTGNNLFSVGEVNGSGYDIGGLVGANNGIVTNSFWDIWTSTTENSEAGSGLSSSALKAISTFADAGWTITIGTADVNNGYPYLLWQENEVPNLSWVVRSIVPQIDFLMYMNDNGHTTPWQLTHTFSIQPANVWFTPVTDATIRLYGPIPWDAATVSSGPAISNYVSGSYIEWTWLSFDVGEGTNIRVDVTLPEQWSYVFTATIASETYIDTDENSNSFTSFSTYDVTTKAPTLNSPVSGTQYTGTIPVSLSISEYPSIGSVILTFTPNDEELDTVIITLDVDTPWLPYNFLIDPSGGISSILTVLSTTSDSIADGMYSVTLSYQDYYNNTAASSIATNVTIWEVVVAPTVSRSWGGGWMSADYCPDGDSSGSYYDNDCGNKTKAQNIVDRITAKRSSRSTERIQSTLAVLVNLNTQIQAKNTVSDSLKALFQEIVDLLISQYN